MALDVNKWFKDNMNALNLSAEDQAAAEKLFSGAVGQKLGAYVYPTESVSGLQSALDKQKADLERTNNDLNTYKDANGKWAEFSYGLGVKYNAIDDLAAAGFDVSNLTPAQQRQAENGGMTSAQVQALLAQQEQRLIQQITAQVEPARQAALDFAEFIAMKGGEHRDEYGKPLDAKKLRAYAFDNRDKFANLDQVYDAFTADERTAKAEADRKKWEADKEKEIELRLRSSIEFPEHAGGGDTGGGILDIVRATPAAEVVSREASRQEFAKKFYNSDFTK